jgi:hypothetical protein
MRNLRWLGAACVAVYLVSGNPAVAQAEPEPEVSESLGLLTANLGQSDKNLLFSLVNPCRLIDTRVAGGILAAGTQREFQVTDSNLSGQGGSATGCGVPFGPTSAILVNLVAVGASGSGNLQAWAWTPMSPPAPSTSVLNFNSNLNIANAIVVPICDPIKYFDCQDAELLIKANFSATHVVADVVGYLRRFPTGVVNFTETKTTSATTAIGTSCTHQEGAEITVFPLGIVGTMLVRANAWLQLNHQNTVDDTVELYIGTSPTDCSCSLGFTTSHTIPAEWPSATNVDVTMPVSCSFQVSGGSNYTYYLNAISKSGSATPDLFLHSAIEVIYNADLQP